ncbi:MAG: hypothetical protein HRU35_06695, partial [Rickettsiaceae bacterium]|nr:hypothetical protein [Rickettsiaceae bacterium]
AAVGTIAFAAATGGTGLLVVASIALTIKVSLTVIDVVKAVRAKKLDIENDAIVDYVHEFSKQETLLKLEPSLAEKRVKEVIKTGDIELLIEKKGIEGTKKVLIVAEGITDVVASVFHPQQWFKSVKNIFSLIGGVVGQSQNMKQRIFDSQDIQKDLIKNINEERKRGLNLGVEELKKETHKLRVHNKALEESIKSRVQKQGRKWKKLTKDEMNEVYKEKFELYKKNIKAGVVVEDNKPLSKLKPKDKEIMTQLLYEKEKDKEIVKEYNKNKAAKFWQATKNALNPYSKYSETNIVEKEITPHSGATKGIRNLKAEEEKLKIEKKQQTKARENKEQEYKEFVKDIKGLRKKYVKKKSSAHVGKENIKRNLKKKKKDMKRDNPTYKKNVSNRSSANKKNSGHGI